ncbi:MAG: DUF4157 domain-containing protein [Spirulina sp. SIO3F2]|nr:DUF4157 domain-containing protein [Spirulina sp. SIO3F2]
MSRQHQIRTSATTSTPKQKSRFAAPPVVQPQAHQKAPAQAPEWQPETHGTVDPLARLKATADAQAKLSIGQPNDKYEQEVDRVARDGTQRLHTPITNAAEPGPIINFKSYVQRSSALTGGEASSELESSINCARGGGQSLDSGLQQSMGQAMGADFSQVKVHTNGQSDRLNRSIQARAFTTGSDVFFRKGEYNPGSQGGQELIAHELTHVVQQGGAGVQRSPVIQRFLLDEAGKKIIAADKRQKGTEAYDEQKAAYTKGMTHFRTSLRKKMNKDAALKSYIFEGAGLMQESQDKLYKNYVATISHDYMLKYSAKDKDNESLTVEQLLEKMKADPELKGAAATSENNTSAQPGTGLGIGKTDDPELTAVRMAKAMAIAVASVEAFEKIVRQLGAESKAASVELRPFPSVKKMERAAFKTVVKYDGQVGNLTDVCAASLVFTRLDEVLYAADTLNNFLRQDARMRLTNVKNRFIEFAKQVEQNADNGDDGFLDDVGYCDMLWNIQLPSGYIGEVQLHMRSLKDTKDAKGHGVYGKQRTLEESAKFIENLKISGWEKIANIIVREVLSSQGQQPAISKDDFIDASASIDNKEFMVLAKQVIKSQSMNKILAQVVDAFGDEFKKLKDDENFVTTFFKILKEVIGASKEKKDIIKNLINLGNKIYGETLKTLKQDFLKNTGAEEKDYQKLIKDLRNFNPTIQGENKVDVATVYAKFFGGVKENYGGGRSTLVKAHDGYYQSAKGYIGTFSDKPEDLTEMQASLDQQKEQMTAAKEMIEALKSGKDVGH